MSAIPSGWRIEPGDHGGVHFEVPASGVDGVFQLTLAEAVSAGLGLITAAERARTSDQMSDTRTPEFAEEAHRQSALAAASSGEAEDQAWVDDISEFNDGDQGVEPIDVLLGGRHELRDQRDEVGRRSIAAHFADLDRPAVTASEHSGRWLLNVDPVVALAAGSSRLVLPAVEIGTADAAREWVGLLATFYRLATDNRQLRDIYVQMGESVIRVDRERSRANRLPEFGDAREENEDDRGV